MSIASDSRHSDTPSRSLTALLGRAGLTVKEAAEYLGITPRTLDVWRCTRRYPIPYTKVGNRIRYSKEDLDAWLASRVVDANIGVAA